MFVVAKTQARFQQAALDNNFLLQHGPWKPAAPSLTIGQQARVRGRHGAPEAGRL